MLIQTIRLPHIKGNTIYEWYLPKADLVNGSFGAEATYNSFFTFHLLPLYEGIHTFLPLPRWESKNISLLHIYLM